MRKVSVKVPADKGAEVVQHAEDLKGKNIVREEVNGGELVTVYLNNKLVSPFIEQISQIDEAEISLVPRGMIALYPPKGEAPDQVSDVTFRSPFEIFLGGIQSVGSKLGLVCYALAGGIIVWIGLYTNTSYLLVAAMLVAPFAGPAMNAALAAASGKVGLLWRSLMRYFLAVGVAVAVCFLLSLLFGQKSPTSIMVSVSQISQVTLLLPLVAGFAGAINLVQSERDSLVSGAAVGMLVAASLAPPTGLVGMAASFGDWQLVKSGLFLILLQLAGIQLSAVLVFRFMGNVTIKGVRFADGKKWVFNLSLIFSVLAIAALMYWQFNNQPQFQRSSLNTSITQIIRSTLEHMEVVEPVEVTARFTRGSLPNQNPVLCELSLLKRTNDMSDEELKERLVHVLRDSIQSHHFNADPKFNIVFLR